MKRPVAATVFGIVNLLFGALGLFGLMTSSLVLFFKVGAGPGTVLGGIMSTSAYRMTMVGGFILGIPQLALLIAAGIGLLKMKRWGRTLSIAYGGFALMMAVVMSVAMYFAFYQPVLASLSSASGPEQAGLAAGVFSGIAGTVFGMLYPAILLFGMYRPALRAAFAEGATFEAPAAAAPLPVMAPASSVAPRERAPLPEKAERMGAYLLIARLAHGAMGEVWEAECTETRAGLKAGDRVALKLVPEFLLHDGMLVERLKREAEAISRLQHPGIVAFHELGEADGRVFMVLELLLGETLALRLEREKRLPITEVERIGGAVADALAYIHGKGIYHRDLKPQNIFLTAAGEVKLIDLGVAKVLDESSLTMTGSHFGTPAYMSPEAFRDSKQVTGAADVWSLGVVLYEMATGQLPFSGNSAATIIAKISDTNVTPQSPARLRPDLPESVAMVIARCLERQPATRGSAAELVRQLGGLPHAVPDDGSIMRRSLKIVLGLATAGFILVCTTVVLLYVLYGKQMRDIYASARAHRVAPMTYETLAPRLLLTGRNRRVQLRLRLAPVMTGTMTAQTLARDSQMPTDPFRAGGRMLQLVPGADDCPVLHIDVDNDGNPRNDPPLPGQEGRHTLINAGQEADGVDGRRGVPIRSFTWQDLELATGLHYQLSLTQHADNHEFRSAIIKPDFTWQAQVRIAGADYTVTVIDYDLNGEPSVGDRWCMVEDGIDFQTRLATRPRDIGGSREFAIGGTGYRLAEFGAGHTVWLTSVPPATSTAGG